MEMDMIKLMKDRTGATAVDYALIAALVSVGAIAGLNNLSMSLSEMFNTVAEAIEMPKPNPGKGKN